MLTCKLIVDCCVYLFVITLVLDLEQQIGKINYVKYCSGLIMVVEINRLV